MDLFKPRENKPWVDDGFVKYGYQTSQQIEDETAARIEEIRVWSNHCEKRGFLQKYIDKREIDNPSNRLDLLYFCPCRGKYGCSLILDFREYNRLLATQRKRDYEFIGCNCGYGKAETFHTCLPRKDYIKKYGEQHLKDLVRREKDK